MDKLIPDEVKFEYCTCVRGANPPSGSRCARCNRLLKDEYWVTLSGFILKAPICRVCHDQLDDCVPPQIKRRYMVNSNVSGKSRSST